jgi:hypothetical protein
MSSVPNAGEAVTLATGGRTTTFDVVVGAVGIALDGAATGLPAGAELWTGVIDGTATSVDDAGAALTATDVGAVEVELIAVLPPDVQAEASTNNDASAATGTDRRAENMNNSASQIRTPDGTDHAPPPPTDVDMRNDTGCG